MVNRIDEAARIARQRRSNAQESTRACTVRDESYIVLFQLRKIPEYTHRRMFEI